MNSEALSIAALEQPTTGWTADPESSSVEFDVKTFWGLTTVHGRFDRFIGTYGPNPDGTGIVLVIDADSIDTGNETRDSHLRSSSFFHVVDHPWIRFESTRVDDVSDGVLEVEGILEAAGHSTFLEFPATLRQSGDDLEIEATTTVDQAELGMSSGPLRMIRRPVTLHVKARLVR
jgi:polyisoprenoid-binding protein YceI